MTEKINWGKRLFALLMGLMMIIGQFGTLSTETAYAADAHDHLEEQVAQESAVKAASVTNDISKTTLAFTSDTHNCYKSGTSRPNDNMSAARIGTWVGNVQAKEQDTIDVMAFGGDMANASASATDFWALTQNDLNVLNEAGVEAVLTTGNHEHSPGRYSATSSDPTQQLFKINKEGSSGDYYRIYCLGSESGSSTYSSSQISALSAYLNSAGNNKVIFIITHFPLHYYSGRTTNGASDVIDALNNAVEKNDQTIVFLWGHNHTMSDSYYDQIYGPGGVDSIQYSSSSSSKKTIKFYYGAAGCMSDSEYGGGSASVKGKGLIATITPTRGNATLGFTYYNESGTDVTESNSIKSVNVALGDDSGTDPGDDPVDPQTGNTVSITPSTDNPEQSIKIAVGDTLTINVTNGSSSSAYDFSATLSNSSAAEIQGSTSVNIAAGETGQFTVKGIANGTVDITIQNSNSYGSQYARKGVIHLTVGEGGTTPVDPTGESVDITPSTSNPTENASIAVGETLTINVTNGSSNNAYDYTASLGSTGIAEIQGNATVNIAAGGAGQFTVKGIASGTVDITIQNNQSSSSYTRKCTIHLTVGEGGTTPVDPPTGDTVSITPTTDNPEESIKINVGDTLTIKVTNGSSSSAYDFTATSSNSSVAQIQGSTSVNIVAGGTGSFTVKGLAEGTADITIQNSNQYGSQYARKGIIHLTVGDGTTPVDPPVGEEVSYVLTATLEAGKEYLIATVNSGNGYILSTDAGSVSNSLKGVSVNVTGNTITINESVAAKTVFNAVQNSSSTDVNYIRLMNSNKYLYADGSGALRMADSISDNGKNWHYRAADKYVLWFFNGSDGEYGYTATGSYKYYLQIDSNGNFTKGIVQNNDQLADANTPKIYLFEKVTEQVAVTGVTLDKTSAEIPVGGELQLTATVAPSNATNKSVSWSSDTPAVATVDQTGKVSGVAVGTAKIFVTTADGNFKAECNVTVKAVSVESVSLDKTAATVSINGTVQLTATVNPENATNKNVTWSSSNTAVATVDQTGKVTGKTEGTSVITVTTQDGSKTATCTVTVEQKTSITGYVITIGGYAMSINPSSDQLVNTGSSSTQQYFYTGLEGVKYNSTDDLTADILWQITETVGGYHIQSQDGRYLNATYEANSTGGNTGTLKLDSTPDVWTLSGSLSSWEVNGSTLKSTNSGKSLTHEEGSSGNTLNLFTIRSTGETSYGSEEELIITAVDVANVTLDKTTAEVEVGKNITLNATVLPENATNKDVTWTTSDATVATVSNGVVTGVAEGTVTITATTVDGGKTASCEVTVTGGAEPGDEKAYVLTDTLEAGKNYVIASANTAGSVYILGHNGENAQTYAASIVDQNGVKTIMTSKTDAVFAANAITSGFSLTNDDYYMTVEGSGTLQFSTASSTKYWNYSSNKLSCASSSATRYLTFSNNEFAGYYSGSNPNPSNIYLFVEKTGSETPVAVTGITLDKTTAEVDAGKTITLTATVEPANATNKAVTWTSSDETVATVSDGVVTGVKEGTTTITVTTADGNKTATCEVTVNAVTEVRYDLTDSLVDGGEYLIVSANSGSAYALKNPGGSSDGTTIANSNNRTAVTIQSGDYIMVSDTDIVWTATANESGFNLTNNGDYLEGASGNVSVFNPQKYADRYWTYNSSRYLQHKGGQSTYTLRYSGSNNYFQGSTSNTSAVYLFKKAGSTTPVEVTGITLDKTTAEVEEGKTINLKATVVPEDATNKAVTWTSSDETKATVANGIVTGVAEGTVTITAKTKDGGHEAVCTVTVKPVVKTKFVEVTAFAADKEYVIGAVKDDGSIYAIKVGSSSAESIVQNVTTENGSSFVLTADDTIVWTRTADGYLQNGSNYLYPSSSNGLMIYSSGRAITFADGKLTFETSNDGTFAITCTDGSFNTVSTSTGTGATFRIFQKYEDTEVHNLTAHAAKEPTCTEPGNIAYWTCDDCGKFFSDANAQNEITEAQTVVAALGHNWGTPAYTWADDNTSVTAVRTCSRCSEKETEMVAATSEVTTPATDTTPGLLTWTSAAFNNSAFTVQTKTEPIPATGYQVSYEWTKTNNGYSVTGTAVPYNTSAQTVAETVNAVSSVTTPATCSQAGVLTWTATFTKSQFSTQTRDEEIPMVSHSLTPTAAKAPTCTEAGNSAYWTCSDCGKYFSDAAGTTEIAANSWVLEAAGHDMVAHAAVAATCTEDGNSAYWSCNNCKKYFSDSIGKTEIAANSWIIEATGHNLTPHASKQATCTEPGNSAYWSCDKCGKFFRDNAGRYPIEENSWVIPAPGHNYGTLVPAVPATCTDDGMEAYYRCSACGKLFDADKKETTQEALVIESTGHNMTAHEAKPATCTEDGNNAYYSCDKCHMFFSDEQGTNAIAENSWVIKSAGHDYGELIARTDATCEEPGMEAHYLCSICGTYFTPNKVETTAESLTIAALGHDPEKVAANPADCETSGNIEHWVCKTCGKFFSDAQCKNEITEAQTVINALGHTWVMSGDPTWTESGDTFVVTLHYECQNDASHTNQQNANVTKTSTDATCTKPGVVTYTAELNSAEALDGVSHKYVRRIDGKPLGHSFGEAAYEWAEDNKSITAAHTCTVCGEIETETVEVTSKVTKAATCTEMGQTTYTSAAFEAEGFEVQTKVLDDVAALGHDLSAHAAVEATCTNAGNSAYFECKTCGKFFSDAEGKTEIPENSWVIPMKEHAYGEWTVTKEATCTEAGEKTRICSVCDKKETQTIEALGHDMTAHAAVEAACTTAGNSAYFECKNCGKFFSDEAGKTEIEENSWVITALGHNWEFVDITWNRGLTAVANYKCSRCEETQTIDAAVTSKTTTEPGCTTEGVLTYTAAVKAADSPDGKAHDATTTEPIAATGHTLVSHAAVDPICGKDGNSAYWSCDACGKYFSDAEGKTEIAKDSWIIPAPGEHSWSEWTVVKEATCEEEGQRTRTCSICGEVQNEVIEAAGHDWIYEKITWTKKSSGGYSSKVYYTCDNCGTTKTVAGTVTVSKTVDPTCVDAGSITYKSAVSASRSLDGKAHTATKTVKGDPATGVHTYGDWVITKAAKNVGSGVLTHTCTVCGAEETRLIKPLLAKAVSSTGTEVKITWKPVDGAERYQVLFAKCSAKSLTVVKTVTASASKTSYTFTKSDLTKNTYYRFQVRAQMKIGGSWKTISTSYSGHFISGNQNSKKTITNVKSITLSATTASVKVGKTFDIAAKLTPKANPALSGAKMLGTDHCAQFRYTSMDTSIAKVSTDGVITGVKAGTVTVYIVGTNGLYKAITVTVKK